MIQCKGAVKFCEVGQSAERRMQILRAFGVPQVGKEAVCTAQRWDRSLSLPCSFLLSTTFAMAFSLNGTHIEGGTFNSVAGKMSQVFTSHVVPAGVLPGNEVSRDHPRLEGGHRFTGEVHVCGLGGCAIFDHGPIQVPLATTTGSSGSIGPIRSQRALRNQDTRPYGKPMPPFLLVVVSDSDRTSPPSDSAC
jgi:hypothetical protein